MEIIVKHAYLKAALICQAKNDVRYYLNGINFMADGRMASTDGYCLFKGFHESTITNSVIIKIKGAVPARFERAVITLPDPVDGDVTVRVGANEGAIRYIGNFEATVGMGWCELVDGRFPDINKESLNTERGAQEVAYIQGALMERAGKVAKLFSPGKGFTPMEVHMPKDDAHSYLIKFKDIENPDRVPQMLVMPYRKD